MSIFDNKDFRKQLAEEEKHFCSMYIEKAKQMLEKGEIILMIADLEMAISHGKIVKKNLEIAEIPQKQPNDDEDKVLSGMELV
jgi:hypothetical protein